MKAFLKSLTIITLIFTLSYLMESFVGATPTHDMVTVQGRKGSTSASVPLTHLEQCEEKIETLHADVDHLNQQIDELKVLVENKVVK